MSPSSGPPLPGDGARRLGSQQESFLNAMHSTIYQGAPEGPQENALPRSFELFDSSVGESRGWGEPLLFVSDSPHIIRPRGQLLLQYDRGKSNDGAMQSSAPPAVDSSEYAHNSLELRSAHRLCDACNDTLNYVSEYMEALNQPSNDFERMKNNVLHSDSLLALSTSATLAQCFICRQIWGKIRQIYPDLDPNTYSDYEIECCWTAVNGMHKETKMWMVMYNPSVQKWPIHNYQHILRLGLWPKAHFGSHFDKDINREKIVNARGAWDECANNDTNDHADTRSLVLSWMARCMQNDDGQHDICNQKDENYIPTRLLDVSHALERGRVRLICPNEMPQVFASKLQYATLSHCWGARGAKENAVLLTSNIESRQSDGLAWDMLPKTFQDAFKVVSWLRIDWLWIDSLCIIQDSQSDWQKEVSMMDRVYMNAEVNISADSGENSRAGCFVKRKDIDTTPLEFANPHIERA